MGTTWLQPVADLAGGGEEYWGGGMRGWRLYGPASDSCGAQASGPTSAVVGVGPPWDFWWSPAFFELLVDRFAFPGFLLPGG